MTICWNYYGYIAAKLQIPTFFEFSPWFCTFCTAPFNLPGLEKKSQWPPLAALFGFFSSHQFGVSQPRGEPSVRIFWLKAVKKWVQPKQPGGGLDPLGSPETEKGLLRDQLRGIPVPIKRPLVAPTPWASSSDQCPSWVDLKSLGGGRMMVLVAGGATVAILWQPRVAGVVFSESWNIECGCFAPFFRGSLEILTVSTNPKL